MKCEATFGPFVCQRRAGHGGDHWGRSDNVEYVRFDDQGGWTWVRPEMTKEQFERAMK